MVGEKTNENTCISAPFIYASSDCPLSLDTIKVYKYSWVCRNLGSYRTQKCFNWSMESIFKELNEAEPSIAKLQNIVDKFEDEPAGAIAYMYLIYDSYMFL